VLNFKYAKHEARVCLGLGILSNGFKDFSQNISGNLCINLRLREFLGDPDLGQLFSGWRQFGGNLKWRGFVS